MADIFSKEKRSRVMASIKSKDTTPEIAVRRVLFSEGFRFRLHHKKLPGKPDIVLKKYHVAIFVNGCFWHGHTCKMGSGKRRPKTNKKYWHEKIENNIIRDSLNKKILRKLGWSVIIIWECQTKDYDRIRKFLHANLPQIY